MKKIIVLAGGLMIMVAACKKDKTEPPTTTTPTATVTPTPIKVTYDADVKIIVNTKCAISGCHVASAQSPDLTTYAGVKSNVGSMLLRMGLTQGASSFMPKGGVKEQADIDKINQWKTDGLLEQ